MPLFITVMACSHMCPHEACSSAAHGLHQISHAVDNLSGLGCPHPTSWPSELMFL